MPAGAAAVQCLQDREPLNSDRLGFRRTIEHGVGDALLTTADYSAPPSVWASESRKVYNVANVTTLLARATLTPDSGSKTALSEHYRR